MSNNTDWITDTSHDAAIKVDNPTISILESGKQSVMVWISTKFGTIYSCYITPNCTTKEYLQFLDKFEEEVSKTKGEKVIAGDFNAKSIAWNSVKDDKRGNLLMDWISTRNLTVINKTTAPIFVRN